MCSISVKSIFTLNAAQNTEGGDKNLTKELNGLKS